MGHSTSQLLLKTKEFRHTIIFIWLEIQPIEVIRQQKVSVWFELFFYSQSYGTGARVSDKQRTWNSFELLLVLVGFNCVIWLAVARPCRWLTREQHIKPCLHVMSAFASTSMSASSYVLSQWFMQRMALRVRLLHYSLNTRLCLWRKRRRYV